MGKITGDRAKSAKARKASAPRPAAPKASAAKPAARKKPASNPKLASPAPAPVTRKPEEWTLEAMIAVLQAPSLEEDIALLKRAGILTKKGKLAKLYTTWGDKVSRTPELDENGELRS